MNDIINYNGWYIVWQDETPYTYSEISDVQELTTHLEVTLYENEQDWLDVLAEYGIDPNYDPNKP